MEQRQAAEQALLEAVAFLVTAWKNLFAYPPGHPARAASLDTAHLRLAAFMAEWGRLALGVTRDGLLYGEKKIESANVGMFAEALYRRNAALVYIDEDVAPRDLECLLRLLAHAPGGPERATIGEELRAADVDRITVTSIDYTRLVTTDQLKVAERGPAGSLWDTLIGALLSGKHLTLDDSGSLPGGTYSATGLADLLIRSGGLGGAGGAGGTGGPGGAGGPGGPGGTSGAGGAAGEGGGGAAISALAGAITEHLTRVRGQEKDLSLRQVAELLRALPAGVREPLLAAALRTLDTEEQSQERLASLVTSLGPDQVLQSLRRLNTEGMRLSSHALRMIQTLAAAREQLTSPDRLASVSADIAEVSALLADEDVDRFNSEDHRALLAQVAAVDLMIAPVSIVSDRSLIEAETESLTEAAVETSLVATLLDLAAACPEPVLPMVVERLRAFFGQSLATGRFERAVGILRGVRALAEDPRLTPAQREGRAALLGDLAKSLPLSSLLAEAGASERLTLGQIQSVVAELGPGAVRPVLEALAAEPDRGRRFQLFDFAESLGSAVVPEATRLLFDTRWFVVRNMILLLRKVGDRSALKEIQRCAEALDPRVGLEAVMMLLAIDSKVSRDLLGKMINHPDPKRAEATVALTGQHGIVEAIDPLVAMLLRWDPLGSRLSLRLQALRALKTLKAATVAADPEVLARLARYFRHWRVPLVRLEERRAAFRLLESYPEALRAPYVRRGQRSKDSVIRAICDRLAKQSDAPPGKTP